MYPHKFIQRDGENVISRNGKPLENPAEKMQLKLLSKKKFGGSIGSNSNRTMRLYVIYFISSC